MVNQATLTLVKQFEGLRLKAYKDSVGVWTVGYGTTAAAGLGIVPGPGMVITEAEAERLLQAGLDKFGAKIRDKITAPINENEWGAFLSLAYNIGPGAFAKSSALRKFNAGDKAGAANAILLWNKAGGKVMKGLVRRRAAERDLFLTPAIPAPAEAPNRPAQLAPASKASPAKEAAKTAAGGATGAVAVLGAVAFWHDITGFFSGIAAKWDAFWIWAASWLGS